MIEESNPSRAAGLSVNADAALLSSIEQGDEEALADLFRLHSKLVYSVALRVLRDTAAADDVLQDVFLQIWKSPMGFNGVRGSLAGWLAIVARNRAIDSLRKRKPAESVDDVPLESGDNVFGNVERTILLERARLAIEQLPVEQRDVLQLTFFEGLTHTEIATKLGHPLGTVKSRIRTAMHSLSRAFRV